VIELALPREGAVPVRADGERIAQVVTNYLTNALKYAPEDRPIRVGVEVDGAHAVVRVHDEGQGIAPSEHAHIWARFYRAPGVEHRSGSHVGLGMGLHISRTIVERHGGHVGVESVPGAGATFWFTIPRAAESEGGHE
jgi:signal transduction histidine kinase